MTQYSDDPIQNVIYQQIFGSIRLCMKSGYYSAAVKLIYSGIDTMAWTAMPAKQDDVHGIDFINWVERYINFEGREQLTGKDLYGARCSMLHNHGVYSRLSRKGECRWIVYADQMYPPVKFIPAIDDNTVIVSVPALADAFESGVHTYLGYLISNPSENHIAQKRLNEMVKDVKVDPNE